MAELLGLLAWLFVEVVLIGTGKAVVALASFGRWRGESLRTNEGKIHGPAGALSFKRNGQRVISVNGLLFVGILFYVVFAIALLVWTSQS